VSFCTTLAGELQVEQQKGQTRRPPNLRQACLEDHRRIESLQFRNNVPSESQQDWERLWRGNPANDQLSGSYPIGWVLENDGGEIVGWLGNIPSAYQFRGRRLRAATPHSWVVDESYRGHGMLILNRFFRQPNVDLFLCTSISPRSEKFTRYMKVSKVPIGVWDRSAFWITNHQGFARIALTLKSFPLPKVTSLPVSAAFSFWDWCNDRQVRSRNSSFEIELCPGFDRRFDDFWDKLQHENEDVLLAVRTRETLAWHFQNALQKKSAWILAVSKGPSLCAYAIFDRQDNPAIGLRRVRLVDFQAHKGFEKALISALSWMWKKCREEGTHVLEVNGCWLDRAGLPPIRAPYHRAMPSWSYYYKTNDRMLAPTLRDPTVWAASSFDGDFSL